LGRESIEGDDAAAPSRIAGGIEPAGRTIILL
jgi:hypothetical protein